MFKLCQLTWTEENIVNEIIRIYKLPLELISEADATNYFIDLETDETICLKNGIYAILEAINCDDRELFSKSLTEKDQETFLLLCAELNTLYPLDASELLDEILVEFDEMGYEPTTLCPDTEKERRRFKGKIIELFKAATRFSENTHRKTGELI